VSRLGRGRSGARPADGQAGRVGEGLAGVAHGGQAGHRAPRIPMPVVTRNHPAPRAAPDPAGPHHRGALAVLLVFLLFGAAPRVSPPRRARRLCRRRPAFRFSAQRPGPGVFSRWARKALSLIPPRAPLERLLLLRDRSFFFSLDALQRTLGLYSVSRVLAGPTGAGAGLRVGRRAKPPERAPWQCWGRPGR